MTTPSTRSPSAASANDTVVTFSSGSITDASGNVWTITTGGQVAVNGITDATTANVIELAYVNGTVWQENASRVWLGKVSPSASWSPTTGTATSALPATLTPTSASTPAPAPAPTPLGSASNPLVIMPLGDSITASGGIANNGLPPPGGYRAPLYAGLTGAGYAVQYVGDQTANPGGGLPANEDQHEGIGGYSIETVNGDTTDPGLLNYIQSNNILQTYKPDLILLQIGYNNLYVAAPEDVGPAQAFTYLEQMVNYIFRTLPNVKLIVSTLPATTTDSGAPTQDPNSSSDLGIYNNLILHDLAPAINNPNLSIVDINGAENGYSGVGGTASLIGPDGVHPTETGFQVIANTWQAGIEKLYAEPRGSSPPSLQASAANTVVTGTSGAICDASGNTGTLTANASPSAGMFTSPLTAPVTIASSTTNDTVSQSQVSVVATAGNHMLFLSGSGDIVSLSGGADSISDTGRGNTYILPAGGRGSDTFSGNILASGDVLDLQTALAATSWNGSATALPGYLRVADTAKGAMLSIAPTYGGIGSVTGTINGATSLTLNEPLTHTIT